MIICCLISQCFIWWPSEKSLGEHRDPISEAIKQSSDWDHSTNPPYLFSKLSPGPLSWFPPNLTATRAVHPWPLQRMSSCRWPRHLDEATDLFFALNDRPWESPARLHPSMATTWRPVGPVPLLLPPPSCSLYKALVQASSELLMFLLLSPVSRWSNRPGDVTSYCSCATSCCALAVRFKIGRQNPGKCAAGWWNFWSSSTISLHYRSRAHHILRKEERKKREKTLMLMFQNSDRNYKSPVRTRILFFACSKGSNNFIWSSCILMAALSGSYLACAKDTGK